MECRITGSVHLLKVLNILKCVDVQTMYEMSYFWHTTCCQGVV